MSTTEITGIQRDDTVHGETYFTAADMATAAAQGFREGQAAELAAMRAGGEPVAEMVPYHTPSGKRVAVISRFQHLPIGTKLYTHPKPAAQDADPLQGAANWLAQAHGQFCVAVLQGCLMIGYNRAKRLHDASIAARKQGANHD